MFALYRPGTTITSSRRCTFLGSSTLWVGLIHCLDLECTGIGFFSAVLSDGFTEHILNLFGYDRHGKLTNTVERYRHRVQGQCKSKR